MGQSICKVEGCERPLRAHGYCMGHYKRALKGTDLLAPWRGSIRVCTHEGCTKPAKGRGLCNGHYGYLKRYGTTTPARAKPASLPGEEWRPIPRWVGYYEASDLGRVRSLDRQVAGRGGQPRTAYGVVLRQQRDDRRYLHVVLKRNSMETKRGVHRLVCMAFHGLPAGHMQVNHIDGDPSNNRAGNLEWCDASHNMLHSYRTGLNSSAGVKNSQAKLSDDDVREIRRLGASMSNAAIARRYPVGPSTISMVLAGKCWRHVCG